MLSLTRHVDNLVPRVSLLCLHCRLLTTMEAEKRDPGNEVDMLTGLFSYDVKFKTIAKVDF